MRKLAIGLACASVSFAGAAAQTPRNGESDNARQQERVGAILGALFGGWTGDTTSSLERQWAYGRFPLAQQRAQFEARIDADIRSGQLTPAAGERTKADYRALVELEAEHGADRRFSTQERADLQERYDALTQVLAEGGRSGGLAGGTSVAEARRDFETRVDANVRAGRLTRTAGTRLKTEYATVARLEADYLRDGVLSVRERDDLETRLDALDARIGDARDAVARPADPTTRLDAVARALPYSGLNASAQAQLRVEHEDLSRLAAAYRRTVATAEEQGYLDRRLADLETRARVRR